MRSINCSDEKINSKITCRYVAGIENSTAKLFSAQEISPQTSQNVRENNSK